MRIEGWGRFPVTDAELVQPSDWVAVGETVAEAPGSLIARGLGRSYGDSSLAPIVVDMRRLDMLLDFDDATGRARCGAGLSLSELLGVVVPRGWFLPVTPGTKFVTVGGAIASDVHGKNHHLRGCFSAYVEQLEVLTGDGRVLHCSESEHAELFRATCGGMGMTGIILAATIRLHRITSSYIEQEIAKACTLEEALDLFERYRDRTYSVAWIDCLAGGRSAGRSLVMTGEHAQSGSLEIRVPRRFSVPVDMPSGLINAHTVRSFNALYYHRVRKLGSRMRIHYDRFFYPLDGIHNWNRLYGKRGFLQYQLVLPKEGGLSGLASVLARTRAAGRGSFLAVLKLLGPSNGNPLSFPIEGYTLALDFKVEHGVFDLLNELDSIVLDHGGRLYLAKDARMSETSFKKSYGGWEAFQSVRERYGARPRFASLQSRRLGLD